MSDENPPIPLEGTPPEPLLIYHKRSLGENERNPCKPDQNPGVLESGYDNNQNSQLDPDEVMIKNYYCDAPTPALAEGAIFVD